jgi:hypothetical protein
VPEAIKPETQAESFGVVKDSLMMGCDGYWDFISVLFLNSFINLPFENTPYLSTVAFLYPIQLTSHIPINDSCSLAL